MIPICESAGVDVAGDYAYVAVRSGGLQIIDISAPLSADIVHTVATDGNAYGAAVSGEHVYVAVYGTIGLQVVDLLPFN